MEFGETSVIGPNLVRETTEMISLIKQRLETAQSKQKSYADKRRSDLEFEVGDRVLLKVSPWKGVIRFRKRGKLGPRYIGPYPIIARVGKVAYRLELPEELSAIHNTFHVSQLRKVVYDETPAEMVRGVIPLLEAGTNIIGGCCGSTPEHIRAFRSAMDQYLSERQ